MLQVTTILLLCTANACRSVMAEGMLSAHLAARGSAVQVVSAGTAGSGYPPPAEVVELMAGWGVDVSGHRGRLVSAADLAAADLVLGMTREHVRHAVVMLPAAWPRAFTLREIIDRGRWAGPPRPAEPLDDWLARAGDGRTRADLLGSGGGTDIADPAGGPWQGYQATAELLDGLTSELAGLCWQGLVNRDCRRMRLPMKGATGMTDVHSQQEKIVRETALRGPNVRVRRGLRVAVLSLSATVLLAGAAAAGVFAYRTLSDGSAAAVPRVTGQHYSAPWVLRG
jgi:protein-tyrosine phosphatase